MTLPKPSERPNSGSSANRGGSTANRGDHHGSRPTVDNDPHHGWDRKRDHVRGHRRYHWSGRNWVIFDAGYPYGYPYGYGYGGTYYPYASGAYYASEDQEPFVPIEARVQQQLKKAGYYGGRVDGVVGPGTRGAIAKYQRDHGLGVNGRINGPLLDSLDLS